MAQQALGIDCSDGEVRGVLLEGSPKKYRLVGFESAPVAAGEGVLPEEALAEALESVVSKLHGGREAAAVAVGSAHCSFRPLSLPFVGEEQIRKVVKFELEGHLHQWNIDDVIVDFYTVSESKGRSQLLVAAASKDHLRQLFGACEKAGFDPVVADLDAAALFNCAVATGAVHPEGSDVFLHVDERAALLVVVERGVLRVARSIRTATQRTEEAPKANGNGGERNAAPANPGGEEAVRVLLDASAEDEVYVSLEEDSRGGKPFSREASNLLIRETERTLTALRLDSPLEALYVSGAWERMEGLAEGLATRLNQAVLVFDPLKGIEHTLAGEEAKSAASWCQVALGAGLKMMEVDYGGIDFRQEELRFRKRFDLIKKELAFFICCLAFALLMDNIYLFKRNRTDEITYQSYFEVALSKAEGLTSKKFKEKLHAGLDPLKRISQLKVLVDEEYKNLKEKMGQASDLKQPQSALEAWRLVFLAVAEIEEKLGRYLVEKVDIVSKEGGANREPMVLATFKFVFLGDSVAGAGARDVLLRKFEEKGWKWTSQGFQNLREGGGIETTIQVELKVPEAQA